MLYAFKFVSSTCTVASNKKMGDLPLNCEISSDLDNLDRYHARYGWVPSRVNIRCDSTTQIKKNEEIHEMRDKWETSEDFISFRIFNDEFQVSSSTGKFRAVAPYLLKSKRQPLDWIDDIKFRQNDFPYGGLLCKHWVLWYKSAEVPPSRSLITEDLIKKLMDLKGITDRSELLRRVSFVWYENPKRNSLSQHFHVQVFWIDN